MRARGCTQQPRGGYGEGFPEAITEAHGKAGDAPRLGARLAVPASSHASGCGPNEEHHGNKK